MCNFDMVFDCLVVCNIFVWMGGCVIVVVVVGVVFVCGVKVWLCDELKFVYVDVIVVLGGELGQCVIGVVELYYVGVVFCVFVSGQGDCFLIECCFVMVGVLVECIGYECVFGSMMENVWMMCEILVVQYVNSVMLVMSWYYIGWVLVVFCKVWLEVVWGVYGVFLGDMLVKLVLIYEVGLIFVEYVKWVWYVVCYWV